MPILKILLRRCLIVTALVCGADVSVGLAHADTFARTYRALLSDIRVKTALAHIKADDAKTFEEQRVIAQIAAPPFKEASRAQDYLRRIRELGLSDAVMDGEGNVVAVRKGRGRGPTLVLSAHLDTVFPENTPLQIRERDGRFHGPGLSDDSRGLAALLAILRTLQASGIETTGDLVFVGTVGEEGAGDLRGVKALFRDRPGIDGFISVEAPTHEHRVRIVNQATGSHRWLVKFKGPGGHSFLDFGSPSAIQAMGRAIANISNLRPPAEPRTTFTVGIVSGGTSVNAIAAAASMEVDMRSDSPAALAKLERQILIGIEQGVAEENARWQSQAIQWEKQLTGNRPAGSSAPDSPIVQVALRSAAALQLPAAVLSAASTDSNVPMALGVPALTLSGGGLAGGLHSPDEWFEPKDAWMGVQHVFLTCLALVGVEGVTGAALREHDDNEPASR